MALDPFSGSSSPNELSTRKPPNVRREVGTACIEILLVFPHGLGRTEPVVMRLSSAMRLLKLMLTASGKQGVPQGGVISPLLSNIYLTEVDRMLERAKEATRNGKYTYVEYARFADDLVVLIDAHPRHAWLLSAVSRRLREEFAKLQVEVNEEKSRTVDLDCGESFGFPNCASAAKRLFRNASRRRGRICGAMKPG